MPIDASIPLGVKVPDGMSSLGNMLGAARSMQQLQTGAIEQKRAGVSLQQEQGALDARRAVAEVMKDPEMRDPETGLLDLNKLAPAIQAADPKNYVWHDALKNTAAVNGDMMKLKGMATTLADQQQAYVGQRVGAVIADPNATRKDLDNALQDSLTAVPSAKPQVDIIRSHLNKLDAETSGNWRQVATVFRNQAFPLADQKPQTTLLNTGRENVPLQTNALNGPVGPMAGAQPVRNEVPPTAKETPAQDLLGNSYIIDRTPDGRLVPKAMPGSGAPPPLLHFPPGESPQSAQQLTGMRTEVNQAAAKVPEQHFNNRQIEKLADTAITGTGAQTWAKAFSTMGLQYAPGDATANYQQLGHFMSLQSQANAKAMGAGTDAARSISEQATGSTAWDAKAIKRATKINDALSTGVDYYNRGMESAINNPDNQKSIFAARDFQNAWSQTFDVNAMRLHNAIQAGDKAEEKTVIDSVGGKNSPGARGLAAKMRALDKLISEGHL
jgi:hypothetical protein